MTKPRKNTCSFQNSKYCDEDVAVGSLRDTVETVSPSTDRKSARPFVLPETVLLFCICLIDMLQTLYVVRSGLAIEANPILSQVMNYSPWAFVSLKSVTFLAPLGAVELLRPKNPEFIRQALRFGSYGYMLVYVFGTLHINNIFSLLRVH